MGDSTTGSTASGSSAGAIGPVSDGAGTASPTPLRRGLARSSLTLSDDELGLEGLRQDGVEPTAAARASSTGSKAPSAARPGMCASDGVVLMCCATSYPSASGMPMSASTMSGGRVFEDRDRLLAVAHRNDLHVLVGERQLDDALDGDAVVGQKQGMGHFGLYRQKTRNP